MKDSSADKHRSQEKTTLTEKNFIDSLFAVYTQNSFGAVSKRELDIFLFNQFQRLGKIHSTDSWEIAKELKISQAKARTLLYESALRATETSEETSLLKKVLENPPHFKDSTKNGRSISLIIDNRYARDTIRSYLREKGFFSDTSFASDVIAMPIDAYIALLKEFQPELANKVRWEELKKAVIGLGIGVLSKIASETATNDLITFFNQIIEKTKS